MARDASLAVQNATQRRKKWVTLAAISAAWIVLIGPWHRSWIDVDAGPASVQSGEVDKAIAAGVSQIQPPAALAIRAGAAAVEIPCESPDIPLAGYGRRAMFEGNAGVADPIHAKAIVIDNGRLRVAIVSADLLLVNRRLVRQTLARLKAESSHEWRREQIFFGATHTHSGPGGYSGGLAESLGIGFYKPPVSAALAASLASAVLFAENALTECTFSYRAAQVEENLIRNRTLETDPANRWLDLLSFRDSATGRSIATAAVFGAHATCRRSSDMMLSADYPGVFCRTVEKAIGGPCLFLAGGVGSMGPPQDAVARDELGDWLGESLARAALKEFERPADEQAEPPLAVSGTYVPLPTPSVRVSRQWRLSPFIARSMLPADAWLHALRIGDAILLGAPADFSGVLAEELRDCQEGYTTVSTSFNGDYVGYVLPESYYELDRYEPGLCFHGPDLGGCFQRAMTQLATAMIND